MLASENYGIRVKDNPAQLDTPITLKKATGASVNAANEETVTYTNFDIMANFQMLTGTEKTEEGRETMFLKARCIIRYYPGLTAKDIIIYDSEEWDIETIGFYGKKDMYHQLNLRKVT